MPETSILAYLMGMGFLAAFIDSVVGGGGLISLPVMLSVGLPPVQALGSNKGAAVMGATMGFFTFLKSKKMDTALIKYLFPLSFVGSIGGALTVRQIPPDFLRPLVVVMLIAVAVYSVRRKEWGDTNTYHGLTRRIFLLSLAVSFGFGFYDGFFGPGAGSFMLFAFLLIGFDFVSAAANARALNFASNLGSFLFFAALGDVNFAYSIPMGIGMIVGAYCGAKMALRGGAAYVRPLFLIVTTVMIGKQLLTLFD